MRFISTKTCLTRSFDIDISQEFCESGRFDTTWQANVTIVVKMADGSPRSLVNRFGEPQSQLITCSVDGETVIVNQGMCHCCRDPKAIPNLGELVLPPQQFRAWFL